MPSKNLKTCFSLSPACSVADNNFRRVVVTTVEIFACFSHSSPSAPVGKSFIGSALPNNHPRGWTLDSSNPTNPPEPPDPPDPPSPPLQIASSILRLFTYIFLVLTWFASSSSLVSCVVGPWKTQLASQENCFLSATSVMFHVILVLNRERVPIVVALTPKPSHVSAFPFFWKRTMLLSSPFGERSTPYSSSHEERSTSSFFLSKENEREPFPSSSRMGENPLLCSFLMRRMCVSGSNVVNFLTKLPSCVSACTEPEDATKFVSMNLRRNDWLSKSHFQVTKFQISSRKNVLLDSLSVFFEAKTRKHFNHLTKLSSNDSYSWSFTKSGNYTVKSSYCSARLQSRHTCDLPFQGPSVSALLAQAWKLKITRKLKHFVWKCISGGLATCQRLCYRQIGKKKGCPRCGATEESISHLLFECLPAREVWALSSILSELEDFQSLQSLFLNFKLRFVPRNGNVITDLLAKKARFRRILFYVVNFVTLSWFSSGENI